MLELVFIACFHLRIYSGCITYMYPIYVYNDGALWWAIYRIPIGHLSDTNDCLLIYTIYTRWMYVHAHIYLQ